MYKTKKGIFVSRRFTEGCLKETKTTEGMKYCPSSNKHKIWGTALWFIPTF